MPPWLQAEREECGNRPSIYCAFRHRFQRYDMIFTAEQFSTIPDGTSRRVTVSRSITRWMAMNVEHVGNILYRTHPTCVSKVGGLLLAANPKINATVDHPLRRLPSRIPRMNLQY